MMPRYLFLCLTSVLLLSACDTVGKDYHQTLRSVKDVEWPWKDQPKTAVAPNTQPGAPVPKTDPKAFTCPPVSIDPDSSQIHQFDDPAHSKPAMEISHAHMASVHGLCTDHGKSLLVDITLEIEGGLGPKARAGSTDKPSFSYPYFLAVTDTQGNVIAQQVYATTLSYGSTEQSLDKTETLRQIIPLNDHTASDYHLVVGFQLTSDQIAYNQSLQPVAPPPEAAAPVAATTQSISAPSMPAPASHP